MLAKAGIGQYVNISRFFVAHIVFCFFDANIRIISDICKKKVLFFFVGFILLEGNAFVEGLGAIIAFGQKMEADTTDMFLGAEVLEIIDFVALDFEFHHAPVLQAHSIASTEVTVDNFGQADEGSCEYTLVQWIVLGCLFEDFI